MQYCDEKEIFGKNLIKLRKIHGLTQKQMAQIMGCSIYCLRKAERGVFAQTLYIDNIENLCRNFQISPSDLFSAKDI